MQKLASEDAATAATPNFQPTARDKGALIEWLGSPAELPQYLHWRVQIERCYSRVPLIDIGGAVANTVVCGSAASISGT
jgi:hypothetical protein